MILNLPSQPYLALSGIFRFPMESVIRYYLESGDILFSGVSGNNVYPVHLLIGDAVEWTVRLYPGMRLSWISWCFIEASLLFRKWPLEGDFSIKDCQVLDL